MEKNGVLDRTPHEVEFVHLPTGKAPNYRYHLQFPEYHLYLSISEKAHKSPNGYLSINSEALWKGSISHLLESIGIDLHHYGGTIERIKMEGGKYSRWFREKYSNYVNSYEELKKVTGKDNRHTSEGYTIGLPLPPPRSPRQFSTVQKRTGAD